LLESLRGVVEIQSKVAIDTAEKQETQAPRNVAKHRGGEQER
jgi:hypothetical protein